jgi:hypothetical protein
VNLRDAQHNPGNGGNGQSAAGGPPAGSQRSVREYAREAGNPVTDQAPSEAAHHVLNPSG